MEDKDKVDKLSINFIYLSIALILSTAIGSFSAYKIATHQPETYEDCVLSNISNVSDSKVSWQIAKSCENKFKVSSTEIPLNKIQELTGFGGASHSIYSNKNDQFDVDLYNGSDHFVVDRLIVGIGSSVDQKLYSVSVKINPLEKGHASIPILPVSDAGKSDWTIIRVYGREVSR